MRDRLESAADVLGRAGEVAIVCHLNPDGDAIGSSLALKLLLESLGKKADVYNRDRVPDTLRGLEGWEQVQSLDRLPEHPELLVFLDCADYARVAGKDSEALDRAFAGASCRLQIDHHGTNPLYCDINVVEPLPATAVLIWRLAKLMGVSLARPLAECLYAALSTDTGNFTQDNTDAECFGMMEELMQAGIRLVPLCRALFAERSRAQVQLIAVALSSIRYSEDGRVTCMYLDRETMEKSGARNEDTDTLVNFSRDIVGVDMTFLARETPDGIRISLRAVAPWRVDGVASAFGGGGHAQASGCTIHEGLAEAVEKVWQACIQSHRTQEDA